MQKSQITAFNAFIAVAEHRNFTRAATQLGISTGSLSDTIRHLEESLGVRLLNRTTRSVAATQAGERLLERLRPLLAELDAALESVNEYRDRPAGSLRIIVPPIVAISVIGPLLSRFLSEYPEIRMEIVVSNKLADIVAERFDAGVRIGQRLEHDMIAMRVSGNLQHVIAASPEYLTRSGTPQTPQDLLNHACIRYRFASGEFLPWKFDIGGKTIELAVEGPLVVNDPALAVAAASGGVGIMYGPLERLRHPIARGELVPVLEDFVAAPSDAFYFFYPSRRRNPAALQALIDFLKRNVGANGSTGKTAAA
jgi:DNA-binding transcriptional LysR family regulator